MSQQTIVTGTITDPSGNPYKNCSYSVSFVNNTGSGTLPLISGSTFQTIFDGGSCDSFGNFSQPLFDNNQITPLGTQWKFSVCDQTGKTCFTYTTPICPAAGCITGTSINISSAISAVAPTLASAGMPNLGTNNTFTGVNIFTQLQGCQYVDTSQSFASALAAASNPGCIEVAPGTYPVSANAIIPSGIVLRSNSGGILSIANTVTLTINGPILAAPAQLFSYTGSGTVTLGAGSVGYPIYVNWFPGADIGAQINNTYAACPASGCKALVSSGSYNFTTPIVWGTSGKTIALIGGSPLTTLNFTPTSGTAISINWGAPPPHLLYGGGVRDMVLTGACVTTACSGVTSTGINITSEGGYMENVSIGTSGGGFLQGVAYGLNGFLQHWINARIYYNNIGVVQLTTGGGEGVRFYGGSISANATAISMQSTGTPGDWYFDKVSFDDNTSASGHIVMGGNVGSILSLTDCHYENPSLGNSNYITGNNGNAFLIVRGGNMLEDRTSGGPNSFITSTSLNAIDMRGVEVYSAGGTINPIVAISVLNGGLRMDVINPFPSRITSDYTSAYTGPLWDMTQPFGSGVGAAVLNFNGVFKINPPQNTPSGISWVESNTPIAGSALEDRVFGDFTTHTLSWNINNNGISSPTGAWQATNVTPVTVNANVSTDQNLMSITIPAGTLNRINRTLRIWLAGVYSTPAASTTAIVVKAKIGALTLATWTSTALAGIQATNDQFNVTAWSTTQTTGATASFEVHGNMDIDLGVGNTVADSNFADVNIATVGTVDTTASQTLQITIAFTVASASNSATQRQLIVETIN